MNALLEYDMSEGVELLCGVDEAGRGPLAGDVYAAAVILPAGWCPDGLNDSKKLSEKKREELYSQITENAISYCVAVATIEEIDTLNILEATMLAMKRAVEGLSVQPRLVLVDGNKNPKLSIHSRCVVKGDATSACIAAASILAKVERDRYMNKLAEKYPQYQFEKHKGYGTALHTKMLDEHGISEVHRKSFLKKYMAARANETSTFGIEGETAAAEMLMQKGYSIIARNFQAKMGEVDIIASKNNMLCFVEVKTRRSDVFAKACEAVTLSKQKKLIQTAAEFILRNKQSDFRNMQIRFDVVEVYSQSGMLKQVNHIENAFNGDGSNVFI